MDSAVLECGRSANIHEFIFKLQNVQIWTVSKCKCLFADSQELHFQAAKFQIRAVQFYFPMLRNCVFTVRNVEIWAVLFSNEVD